jgi:hypothetical protein
MTSRTDPNLSRRENEREYKDIEYVRRVRDVSKECPMIVSLINKLNAQVLLFLKTHSIECFRLDLMSF